MTERRYPNAIVREWFEQRTYRHVDFQHLGRGSTQPSVTLVLPARSAASTIGKILSTVASLRARTGLPDQVIIMDADSPDGTAAIGREHNAELYSENELMRDYGPALGKGDAMWRSLAVARGNIIMFADADTLDFGEHFVYGIVGPLLADPGLQFVKAAYRQPFIQGELRISDGGGRVAELMAKPLLNLFYPELAGFVQPLAGEFAVRRELLMALPFFTGYAAEAGLMIDVYAEVGLPAMAQVDLGVRHHAHQSLSSLSRASSVVLRTIAVRDGLTRANPETRGTASEEPGLWEIRATSNTLDSSPGLWDLQQPDTYLYAIGSEEGMRLDEHLNELVERPPMGQLTDGTALTATI